MALSLSREQIRSIDKLAVERYGIPSLILMENAGRGAAEIVLGTYGPAGHAVVFCGTGNNGGDGCVIARHLYNAGWPVRVVMVGHRDKLADDARTNLHVVETMNLVAVMASDADPVQRILGELRGDELLIDALLGTGFAGEVRSPIAEVIHAVNAARKRAVVAVDVPSGLDCQTGRPGSATIRADLTVTFVAWKTGFNSPAAREFLGRVEVASIGAPRDLIEEIAVAEPPA